MKLTRVIAWALCACPLLLAADTSGRRPAAPSDASGQFSESRASDNDSGPSAIDNQWDKVESWMREHCPNRVGFVQKLRSSARQEQARRLMIERYNAIQKIAYKPMRDAQIAEMEAQDQVFGAQWELKRARGGPAEAALQTQAEADLRAAVTHLFDAQQTIKHVQLKRHQEEIDRLKKEIENQERHRTQIVENWYKNMKNRADSVIGGGPPNPNGRTQNAAPNDPRRPANEP